MVVETMGAIGRSLTAILIAACFLTGVVTRHTHDSETLCVACLFTAGGRRSADLPFVSSAEVIQLKTVDARRSVIRVDYRQIVPDRVACRHVFRPPDDESQAPITGPPVARLRDIAAGLYGRAPPTAW